MFSISDTGRFPLLFYVKLTVFLTDLVQPCLLRPIHAKAHASAQMIVFQDAVAHPLPAWDILGGFDVVGMIGDASQKHHARGFHDGVVGDSVEPNPIALFQKLGNDLLIQSATTAQEARMMLIS